jgi:flagellar biosynthesis chaperone FliJ
MKRFVWRLQKVLDVKSKQEQLKRMELFRITEQLAAQRGELLLRQRILQDLMAEIKRHESPQRLNAQEFFLRHAATDDEQIRRLQEEIAALEIRHKEKTAEVLAVRRFKEGLEKLREKAKEEYMREQEKLEQKELDERTTIAFVRNESGMEDRGRAACAVIGHRSSGLPTEEQNK